MALSLIQYRTASGERAVAALDAEGRSRRIGSVASVYDLAVDAASHGLTFAQAITMAGCREDVDLASVIQEGRILSPIDHPEISRLYLTGTGLTHLGSAQSRDAMHHSAAVETALQSDSMEMFLMGVKGGKPAQGNVGVQPEWFYKGNGQCVALPGQPIVSPAFALDSGEEAEIAGVYLIGPDGMPIRLGFCLANEFSDHVTERGNYLWLSHSKLRQAALGPELLTGALPQHVQGTVRILRNGSVLWEKPFLSGEGNMSHTIENLERHHFKYHFFRRPGDLHIHFFGAAILSFTDGVRAEPGDVFEIKAAPFRLALRNTLAISPREEINIRSL